MGEPLPEASPLSHSGRGTRWPRVDGPGPSPRRSRAGSEARMNALQTLCIVLWPGQHAGEQLGEVDALAAKVPGLDLSPAGEPVRKDRDVQSRVPDRGEQPV